MFSPVVSTRLTGAGFYKLGTSIVLSSLVLAMGADYFMHPALDNESIICYLILIIANVITLAFHRDQKSARTDSCRSHSIWLEGS